MNATEFKTFRKNASAVLSALFARRTPYLMVNVEEAPDVWFYSNVKKQEEGDGKNSKPVDEYFMFIPSPDHVLHTVRFHNGAYGDIVKFLCGVPGSPVLYCTAKLFSVMNKIKVKKEQYVELFLLYDQGRYFLGHKHWENADAEPRTAVHSEAVGWDRAFRHYWKFIDYAMKPRTNESKLEPANDITDFNPPDGEVHFHTITTDNATLMLPLIDGLSMVSVREYRRKHAEGNQSSRVHILPDGPMSRQPIIQYTDNNIDVYSHMPLIHFHEKQLPKEKTI